MSNVPGIVINGSPLSDSLVGTEGDDTINANTGVDTVLGRGGDDVISVIVTDEFSDSVNGGTGVDTLKVTVVDTVGNWWIPMNMSWTGYDALGNATGLIAVADQYDMAYAQKALSSPTLKLNTSNGNPGVWIQSIENLSVWTSQRVDSDDMLVVIGTGTYNAYGGHDGIFANWSGASANIAWDNQANDSAQLVNGSTISNVEKLFLKTGSGNDDLRNTHVVTNDEFETGAGNDTIYAGAGQDRVDAGPGDDFISVLSGGEYSDVVHGGTGTDTLSVTVIPWEIAPSQPKNMWWTGYDANGTAIGMIAVSDVYDMAYAQLALSGVSLKLNTANGYPGVMMDGIENLSVLASTADDSDDMLVVIGTGTYNAYGGHDGIFANWSGASANIAWDNQANDSAQLVNGSTISNVEKLFLKTGSGNDDLRNTHVVTNDEFETGAGNDTIYAGAGQDRVDAGPGDDFISVLSGGEYSDVVHGGTGTDTLSVTVIPWEIAPSQPKNMWWTGYDANGTAIGMIAVSDVYDMAYAQLALSGVSLKLNTANGYPGVMMDGIENLSVLASTADDSDDMLVVIGTGTYNAYGGHDGIFANWSGASANITWDNQANDSAQLVNGSTISNVEKLFLKTGSGNDDLRNTHVVTNDEFETGAGNDTIYAGLGTDRVDAGPGDDVIVVMVGSEFADGVHGGAGVDRLTVDATASMDSAMAWTGLNNADVEFAGAGANASMATIQGLLAGAARINLSTGNYKGVVFDGIENLSLLASTARDLNDLLCVQGSGTYAGGGGTDTLYADWSNATSAITLTNQASAQAQVVNGSTISSVERLLVRTGSGADDIRNLVAATNDEFETGAGNDTVYAGGGDDRIFTGAGNDFVDGGTGTDTAVFAGNKSQYTVVRNAGATACMVNSTAEGSDWIANVEYLQFADGTYSASSFPTVDNVAPTVVSYSPADEATGVATAANIMLTFSEAIQRGAGSIVLKNAAGSIIETFDAAASARVSVAGSTLTLDPSVDLASMTGYRVEFSAGTVKDMLGNGIVAITSYNFTTGGASYFGTTGDDLLSGDRYDNTFTPGLGNDTVNAGDGQDTVILPMFPNVFSLSEPVPGHVTGAYAGNTLVLNDVELIQFGANFQTTLPLSMLVSGQAQLQLGRLTDLYLAFFGRAPDTSGLEYWQERLLEEGRDFATISKDFAWSPEAQALFPPAASNRAFVQTVYVNCFGRQPDPGGWDYWTGRLDGLGVTDLNDRGAFVGEVILGAYAPTSGAEDRTLLTNRHGAAMYYVNQLSNTPAEGFDAGINTLLAKVTGDAGTEAKAEHVIDYAFANPITLTGIVTDPTLLDSIWGA